MQLLTKLVASSMTGCDKRGERRVVRSIVARLGDEGGGGGEGASRGMGREKGEWGGYVGYGGKGNGEK